jgi:hypothetical protein
MSWFIHFGAMTGPIFSLDDTHFDALTLYPVLVRTGTELTYCEFSSSESPSGSSMESQEEDKDPRVSTFPST